MLYYSPHEKAFSAFDKINPEIIIVCDYADHLNAKGFQTYQNFSRYIAALKKNNHQNRDRSRGRRFYERIYDISIIFCFCAFIKENRTFLR